MIISQGFEFVNTFFEFFQKKFFDQLAAVVLYKYTTCANDLSTQK